MREGHTCWGVAVLPVPIAQTGSYAITTFFHSPTLAAIAFTCWKTTASVCPASRSSNFSPMQAITLRPLSRAWATFSAINYRISGIKNGSNIYKKHRVRSYTIWFAKYVPPFRMTNNNPINTNIFDHSRTDFTWTIIWLMKADQYFR